MGLSVNACGELCFSGGSNLPKTMPSVGSLGLPRCGYLTEGINDGKWESSHVGIMALLTSSSRKDDFQVTPVISLGEGRVLWI